MTNIIGAILAGGKSSRFDNQNKALALLAGKPLVQHVIDRLVPQVSQIVFSGEPYSIKKDDHFWIADLIPGKRGPLVGVLSCLDYLQDTDFEWLLTSACDTPLLPTDLGEKLLSTAQTESALLCVPHDGKRLQPASALWHRDILTALNAAVKDNGVQGFHQFMDTQPYATCYWKDAGNQFINLNTQLDLANAETLLRSH